MITDIFGRVILEKVTRDKKGISLLEIPNSFVVFDIETTGLDFIFDEIIEIGAIKIENGIAVDSFNSLIKPKNKIDEFITELTGITNEMLVDAPSIREVLPKFVDFIGNSILVGHNVNFDINFVYDNLVRNEFDPISNDFVDTMRISRRLLKDLKHHRLIDLAEYYNIDIQGNHRSLKDAEITLQVFHNLRNDIEEKYGSVSEFVKISKNKPSYFKASDITTEKKEFDEENEFFGKNVAITGTLEKMTRKEAMQIIVDLGGHCEDGVTSKTNYLILGNNDYNPILRGKKSSKLIKAEKAKLEGKDIEILSENAFYEIINDVSY